MTALSDQFGGELKFMGLRSKMSEFESPPSRQRGKTASDRHKVQSMRFLYISLHEYSSIPGLCASFSHRFLQSDEC